MLGAIISAAVCLAAATMMYTPRMRSFQFYRQMGLIFLFEGVWLLLDYIFRQIFPDNVFMMIIHYVGLVILVMYLILSILFGSKEQFKEKMNEKKKQRNGQR